MKGIRFGLLSLVILASPYVYADSDNNNFNPQNIELYFNGAPNINTGDPAPGWKLFQQWCANSCFPTTTFTFVDPVSEKELGKARVWGKDIRFSPDGNTLCFTEFIEYTLKEGIIYTLGRTAGTCGTFMDKTLVPPTSNPDAEVLAGGGDGNIVGGTRKYSNIKGTYNDRVFVEFVNRAEIVFYDALFFNLMVTK